MLTFFDWGLFGRIAGLVVLVGFGVWLLLAHPLVFIGLILAAWFTAWLLR